MKLKFSFVSAYLAYTFSVLIVGIAFLSCKSNKTAYVSSSGSIKNISFAGYNAVEVLSPYIIKGSADSWSFNGGLNATNQVSESSVSEFIKLVNSSNGIFYKHCFYTGCRYERASKKMNSNYMGCYLSGKYVNTRVVLFKKKELEQTKNIIISNDEERNCFCQMMNNSSVVQTAVKTYDQKKENDAYNNAMSENSISKLQDFLRTYPSTQFRNKVTEKINDLDKVEKSRRAADEVVKKTEVDKKRKIIQEKGSDYVYEKGEWTSSGLFNEMYCDIIFADETKARIYSVREGYYFWAFREKIYYETESSAIKAAYEAVTKKTLSNTGRIFPGTISSSSSSSSSGTCKIKKLSSKTENNFGNEVDVNKYKITKPNGDYLVFTGHGTKKSSGGYSDWHHVATSDYTGNPCDGSYGNKFTYSEQEFLNQVAKSLCECESWTWEY